MLFSSSVGLGLFVLLLKQNIMQFSKHILQNFAYTLQLTTHICRQHLNKFIEALKYFI